MSKVIFAFFSQMMKLFQTIIWFWKIIPKSQKEEKGSFLTKEYLTEKLVMKRKGGIEFSNFRVISPKGTKEPREGSVIFNLMQHTMFCTPCHSQGFTCPREFCPSQILWLIHKLYYYSWSRFSLAKPLL